MARSAKLRPVLFIEMLQPSYAEESSFQMPKEDPRDGQYVALPMLLIFMTHCTAREWPPGTWACARADFGAGSTTRKSVT